MKDDHNLMTPRALVPVFFVADVTASVDYYTRLLGFTQSFRYGTYAGVTCLPKTAETHSTSPDGTHPLGGVSCCRIDRHGIRFRLANEQRA